MASRPGRYCKNGRCEGERSAALRPCRCGLASLKIARGVDARVAVRSVAGGYCPCNSCRPFHPPGCRAIRPAAARDSAVPARRQRRRFGARHQRGTWRCRAAADRRREPPGRRRLNRLRPDRARGSRRQSRGRRLELAGDQSTAAQGQLRLGRELHAGLQSRRFADDLRGQSGVVL